MVEIGYDKIHVEKIHVEKIHEFSLSTTITTQPKEKIHEFSLPPTIPTSPTIPTTENDIKQYRRLRRKMLIPMIIGKFQQQTSKQINILRNTPGAKTWQPNYHDHVIRDKQEYERIRLYIINNPANWENDTLNGVNDGN